ncbi:MAG: hypothetical protein KAW12_30095 [Candidatus Aminicenantes bacterium]|nr:hypothetical protein [Candidatus Aminicenantes bacterium]
MKKKQLLLIFLVILFLSATAGSFLFAEPEQEQGQKLGITYFSAKSLYFYLLGSFNNFDPPYDNWELGSESSNAFAPVYGVGYRLVNFGNRFFINFEADYAPERYDFRDFVDEQKITTLTFMVDIEWHLRRSPLVFTFGMGAGLFRLHDLGYYDLLDEYVYLGSETITAVTMRFGMKIPISRDILLRGEIRWSGESYGGSYDYYWDEYYGDGEWDYLSSALCFGLEFHL